MKVIQQKRLLLPFIIVLLIALTGIAYLGVFNNHFINFDDNGYVTKNAMVQQGLSIETIRWAFTTTTEANWHPLTWLSHALDCTLFGLNPVYHHATSLFLHLLSTIILFLTLERMTKEIWKSAFVAAVFALHPLHVESVAWVAERKDVLSGFFWVLTLATYVRYCYSKRYTWYIVTLFVFMLGLLSKPMLVTLPFVMILLDYWPLQRFQAEYNSHQKSKQNKPGFLSQSIKEKIPMIALSIASSIITFLAQREGGATKALTDITFINRIANALVAYIQYMRTTILPTDLSVFYPHPGNNIMVWYAMVALAVFGVISIVVWKHRTRYPYLIVGWLWFIGTLIPVIGIIQVGLQAMADRYMYLPIIGLTIMIAWWIPSLIKEKKFSQHILRGTFGAVVLLMLLGTRSQVAYWKDSRTLFEHAVAVTSNNYIAYNNLGAALADSGHYAEAITRLKECLDIKPDYLEAHQNLARSYLNSGNRPKALDEYSWMLRKITNDPVLYNLVGGLLADEGREQEATECFLEAIRRNPEDIDSRCKVAELYAQANKLEEAQLQCQLVLRLQPQNSQARSILGIIAGKQGNNEQAAKEFAEAIRIDATNADAYINFGIFYERNGDLPRATGMYREAIRLDPSNWNAHSNMGTALAQQQKPDEAEIHWLKAVALNPEATNSRINLGKLYTMEGKIEDAIQQFTEALRIDPTNVYAHYNFGNLLLKQGKITEAKAQYYETLRLAPSFQPAIDALQKLLKR